jgi:galactose mutarotase-like enzyme
MLSDVVRIGDAGDRAEIRYMGAELTIWRIATRDLLWTAKSPIWPRTSPVLFPIVGRLRDGVIAIGAKKYPMGVHGFAAAARFTQIAKSEDSVCLRLTDTAATRSIFPFSFELDISYWEGARRLAPSLRSRILVMSPSPMRWDGIRALLGLSREDRETNTR